MEHNELKIPIGLVEAALNSKEAVDLISGRDTHMPTLHFVGNLLPFTQNSSWIQDIVAGYLPADYRGNTLKEIPKMVSDSIAKGYAAPKSESKAKAGSETALKLIEGPEMELFHTPQHVGFAAILQPDQGAICYPVRSEAMKGLVRLRYHRRTGKTISREQMTEVTDLLEARANFEAPEEDVHVRVAGVDNDVLYDLGRHDGALVKITPTGWLVVRESKARFYRPNGFGEQVIPSSDGNLEDLRDLLHLDDKNYVLLLAFLIISLKPTNPYMVLLLSGGHGSGKSKISELAKRIIDPNALEKFRLPKDEHSLAIQASMTWMLVYDNTSSVKWDLSDAICAMLTGGGFSTRKFFTDDEQRTFRNARPAIINGIGEFASQHDLLDRAIAIKLPAIAEGTRLTEKVINARFEAMLPGILGRLFTIVSVALRDFDTVEPPTTIRMADAAQWLMAAEPATGLPKGTFLRALQASVKEVTVENTINHPLVLAIFKTLDTPGTDRRYEGTVGDFHDRLRGEYGRLDPQLPQTASHLSNMLQRLSFGMAEIGLMVELKTRTNQARPLRIWVAPNEYTPPSQTQRKQPF